MVAGRVKGQRAMSEKQQIIKVARMAAKLMRTGHKPAAEPFIGFLWDAGCHSDELSGEGKETCRRCALALVAIRQA